MHADEIPDYCNPDRCWSHNLVEIFPQKTDEFHAKRV